MLRFLGFLVILALIVGGIGYARGWFFVDKNPATDTVTFGMDKNRLEEDLKISRARYDEQMTEFDAKLARLKAKASAASAGARESLDRQVAEFERDREDLARKLSELKNSTKERFSQLKEEIEAAFRRMGDAIDRALE